MTIPRLVLLIILAGFTSSATAQEGIHTTRKSERLLPLPKEEGVFHFLIYGDRTGGPPEGLEVLRQAVKDSNLLDPDLVMNVGDMVPGYGGTEEWLKDTNEYKGIMQDLKMPWFPVAGNHDIYWRGANRPPLEHETNYEKHFGPLWYWFKHKDTGFLVLYTDEGDATKGPKDFTKQAQTQMSPTQLDWLKQSLQEMKGLKNVMVFMHHPRWIEKTYKGTNWDTVHQALVAAGNVKAVFAGHIHRLNYGGNKDGIEYFALATTGGGSVGNYPGAGYIHHMNLVTVRPEGLHVSILPVGQVLDPRIYTLERQEDIDKARSVSPQLLSPRIPLDEEGLGAGLVQFRLENTTKQPLELNLIPDQTNNEWFFAPDHIHTRLEVGETKDLSVTIARVKKGYDQGLTLPVVNVETDYLTEGARITLPPRKVNFPIGMKTPDPSFFAPAAENQALTLNGRSAYRVEMSPKDLPDGPFTVEAWVKTNTEQGTAPFVAKTEQSEFALNLANNIPGFHCHLGNKYISAIAPTDQVLPAGKWIHLAGVFDGAEMRLYVNGKVAAKVPASGPRTTNVLPMYIGADPDAKSLPTQFFTGSVDEVRLSTVARYTAEFPPAERFSRDDQTLYLFHCDKEIGPFVPSDSAGNRYATKSGQPAFTPAKLQQN
jgi:hypothetical protein